MHVLAPLALLLASVALPASAFSPHTFHIHHLSTSASRSTAKGLRPTSVLSASRSTAKGLRRAAWTAGRTPAPPPPLPTINLAAGTSSATIYPFGACVTSYVRDGFDYLFVRPDAKLDGSKPISGGLPFCWPAFGPPSDQNAAVGELQQHGFARNLEWEVESSGGSSAVLTLAPNEYTRGMWDKEFKLTYTVTLTEEKLSTSLSVANTGPDAWSHQGALHSYFRVGDIDATTVRGSFEGKDVLDKVKGERGVEGRAELAIAGETDAVYTGVTDPSVHCGPRSLSVTSTSGWQDCVVWNPHGDDGMGYRSFVCVESALFEPQVLEAGKTWTADMELKPGE